jgi:hypothetical protein
MKFKTAYEPQDYYEANKLFHFTTWYRFFLPLVGILCIVAGLLSASVTQLIIQLFIGGSFILWPYTWMRPVSIWHFRRMQHFHDPYEWEVDERGLRAKNKYESSESSWDSFVRFKVNNKILLLFKGPKSMMLFPKRLLTDDEWNYINKLASQKIKKF